MNRLLCILAVLLTIPVYGGTGSGTRVIILPSPALLGCDSSSSQRMWRDDQPKAEAVYPKQLSIDFKDSSPYGLTALYEQSTPIEAIKAALDKDYEKWAMPQFRTAPIMMWRVEPEKVLIQLSVSDDGMPQLIYITLRPELRPQASLVGNYEGFCTRTSVTVDRSRYH